MPHCKICQSSRIRILLDFGLQPLSNRYLRVPSEKEALFPAILSQCQDCALIQIADPIAASELKPRFDWITYNEPEGHLDEVVSTVCELPGVSTDCKIAGVSFKDDSTLSRFQRLGFDQTWRVDKEDDFGVKDMSAGLETIQALLTPETARKIRERRGPVDVLIVRHILEHAHNTAEFLSALLQLVKLNGYLVFEVPDCSPALDRNDYTMFWEEHVSYFVPETFRNCLVALGFSVVLFKTYTYSNENSLVAIAQTGGGQISEVANESLLKKAESYATAFADYRDKLSRTLTRFRETKGKVAVFGAGHLSTAWINFLQMADYIEFVIDDHPKKIGLFMPGSKLQIRASADLTFPHIRLCLTSLSPESEAKILQKNQAYINAGGQFASIFPGNRNSFIFV